jgi:hypothetical protein
LPQKPLENANGTIYRIANIEFEDINGNTQKSSAMVYEGNYGYGMEIGKTFLAKATLSGGQVYLQVSHLEYNGSRATVDMFGFEVEATAFFKLKLAVLGIEATGFRLERPVFEVEATGFRSWSY